MMVRRNSPRVKQDDTQGKTRGSKQNQSKGAKSPGKIAAVKATVGKLKARKSPVPAIAKVTKVAKENKSQENKLEKVRNRKSPVSLTRTRNVKTQGNRSQEKVKANKSVAKSPKPVTKAPKKTVAARKSPRDNRISNKTKSPKSPRGNNSKSRTESPKKSVVAKSPRGASRKSKGNTAGSDDGYVADKESLSSQHSDLYDFENSEENFEPSPTTGSAKGKRKQTPNTDSGRRKKVAKVLNTSSVTNIPQKPQSKGPKKTGLNVSKGTLRAKAMKNCVRSSVVDSGVFMTPSPLQDTSATFHVSFSSKPTSTPTGVVAAAPKKLGAPLIPPPDLSPVKRVRSPNSGGLHGKLLSSPDAVDTLTPAPQESAKVTPAASEDDPLPSTLDISKTYKNCSFRTLDDKKAKGKKTKKSNKKARYSTSKYEAWVDKKATEFEEIEQFELSIEAE